MSINIRREEAGDVNAIYAVHQSCFPTEGEAKLVDSLRDAGRLTVSLLAVDEQGVVGHVAFSPVTAGNGASGLGLGPLAVAARSRRQGVGARLVRAGLEACRAADCGWVVVLGDPAYYSRFGFRAARQFGLSDEYGGGEAFQAVELTQGSLPQGAGLIRYAPEFAALE
jgi:putative acetyltransferase